MAGRGGDIEKVFNKKIILAASMFVVFLAVGIFLTFFSIESAKAAEPQFRINYGSRFFDYDPNQNIFVSLPDLPVRDSIKGLLSSEDGKYIYIAVKVGRNESLNWMDPTRNGYTRIYRSDDRGQTWTYQNLSWLNGGAGNNPGYDGHYLTYVSPSGQYVIGTYFYSDDFGAAWKSSGVGAWTGINILAGNIEFIYSMAVGLTAMHTANATGKITVNNPTFFSGYGPLGNSYELGSERHFCPDRYFFGSGDGNVVYGIAAVASFYPFSHNYGDMCAPIGWTEWTYLYRSDDGGRTFGFSPIQIFDTRVNGILGDNIYLRGGNFDTAVSNNGKDVVISASGLFISHDYGQTFEKYHATLDRLNNPPDYQEIIMDSNNPDLYYFTWDNGTGLQKITKYPSGGGVEILIDEFNLGPVPLNPASGFIGRMVNFTSFVSSDFSIKAVPTTQTISAGQSTSYTVTVGADPEKGFQGDVTLSASVANGSGFTTNFPQTVNINNNSQSVTLTVNSPANASAESRTITITATSGSTIKTAIVNLEIIRLKIIGDVYSGARIGDIYIAPGSVASANQTVTAEGTQYKISGYNPVNLVKWELAKQKMTNTIARLTNEVAVEPTAIPNGSTWKLDTANTNPSSGTSDSGKYPDGKVWLIKSTSLLLSGGTLNLGDITFSGKGTIIVEGNVNITGNLIYSTADPKASLGIIANNITINASVGNLVGAYYTTGEIKIK